MGVTTPLLAAVLSLSACSPASATGEPPPYSREAFGDGWASTGGGCDVRDAVLRRDVVAVTTADRCGPLAGTLRDPYSGLVVVGPTRQLDVDHVVPLEWLWVHGAWAWPRSTREAVANDPLNLVATTQRSNRSKGSRGLDEWLPEQDRCGYASRFDAVADRYGLVDDARDGLVVRTCAGAGG